MVEAIDDGRAPTAGNWLNGTSWVDGQAPGESMSLAADRGIILGDGLYETLRLRQGRPVLFRAHVERLEETAEALEFVLPEAFRERLVESIDALHPRIGEPPMAWLRITVTRGVAPPGLAPPADPRPNLLVRMVAVEPRPARPQRAWIVDRPRIDPADPLSGRKTISSMRWVLAHQEARRHDADIAILRTIDGDLAEADTASIFVVTKDAVITPSLSRGILPSTTRDWIIERLRDEGRDVREILLHRNELERAREVFLSSSVAGIRPLVAVDDLPLAAEAPVCASLAEAYERLPADADDDWRLPVASGAGAGDQGGTG